jgi:hypothetical protein
MKRVSGPVGCGWCAKSCVSLCDFRVLHSSPDFYPPRPAACNLPMCETHTSVEDNGAQVCPSHHKILHPEAKKKTADLSV